MEVLGGVHRSSASVSEVRESHQGWEKGEGRSGDWLNLNWERIGN